MYGIKDIYNGYMTFAKGSGKYEVSHKTFASVFGDYMKFISVQIIYNAKELKLPARFGTIHVRKRKCKLTNKKFLVEDPVASREYKKKIFFTNDHSDGFSFSFKWTKSNIYTSNISMYELIMSRDNKRTLAKAIKNKITDYII